MNRLRVALLSLLVLALIAGALPVTDSLAKWSRRSAVSKHKRYKRHSRAWWRRHRALMRARRERAAQRRRERELRLAASPYDSRAARLYANAPASVNLSLLTFDAPPALPTFVAPASFARGGTPNAAAPNAAAANISPVATVRRAQMPFDFNVPSNWSPAKRARQGEAVYNVLAPDGRSAGTAVLAPVSLS